MKYISTITAVLFLLAIDSTIASERSKRIESQPSRYAPQIPPFPQDRGFITPRDHTISRTTRRLMTPRRNEDILDDENSWPSFPPHFTTMDPMVFFSGLSTANNTAQQEDELVAAVLSEENIRLMQAPGDMHTIIDQPMHIQITQHMPIVAEAQVDINFHNSVVRVDDVITSIAAEQETDPEQTAAEEVNMALQNQRILTMQLTFNSDIASLTNMLGYYRHITNLLTNQNNAESNQEALHDNLDDTREEIVHFIHDVLERHETNGLREEFIGTLESDLSLENRNIIVEIFNEDNAALAAEQQQLDNQQNLQSASNYVDDYHDELLQQILDVKPNYNGAAA